MHIFDLKYESPLSNTSRWTMIYDGINQNIFKLTKDKCIFPDDINLWKV